MFNSLQRPVGSSHPTPKVQHCRRRIFTYSYVVTVILDNGSQFSRVQSLREFLKIYKQIMSSWNNRHLPTVVVKSCRKKSDPLLDLLSMSCGDVSDRTLSGRKTSGATGNADPLVAGVGRANCDDVKAQSHGNPPDGGPLETQRGGLLKESTVKVRARRRLLKRDEEGGKASGQKEKPNLASLAAQAGAHAANGVSEVLKELTRDSNSKAPPSSGVKKARKSKKKNRPVEEGRPRRVYKKKTETSNIVVNGTAIPRIVGVPDSVVEELASLAPGDRPVRCRVCRSCENPARKKACEVIRALGANPPIPRGKNRLAILGPENMKKHVSRTCDGPLDISPSAGPAVVGKRQQHKSTDGTEDVDGWTDEQLQCLYQAILEISPNTNNFWQKVAVRVPDRNEADCFAKIHESVPYYSGNSKPRKGSKRSKRAKALDPNSENYVSDLLERRRERALGHIASSRFAALNPSDDHCLKSGDEGGTMKEHVTSSRQQKRVNDIQMMLLDQRKDDDEDSPHGEASDLSRDTWSEEF